MANHSLLEEILKRWLGISGVVIGAAMVLAGCTNGGSTQSSSTPSASAPGASTSAAAAACKNLKSGSVVDAATVKAKRKANPAVKFTTPLNISAEQRRVVNRGTGEVIPAGSSISIDAAVYSGTSGKLLQSAGFADGKAITVTTDASKYLPGLVRASECLPAGSMSIYAAPVSAALGGVSPSQIGISASEKSLVIVTKVVAQEATRATGAPQPAPAGFPKVTLAANGAPTIGTTQNLSTPKSTKVGVLKQGTGTKVKKSSTVSVQYAGVIWKTGKVFDSSWQRGAPTSFAVTGVVKGFQKALIGHRVGSQVIVAIPPKDGYGSNPPSGIGKTDTLLFVIDILSAQS